MYRKNNFSKEMGKKSDAELKIYIHNKNAFTNDEVMAARWELEERGQPEPDVAENIFTPRADSNNIEFPQKPAEESNNSAVKSLVSLVLFIGLFYLFFKWDITYILILAGVLFIHEAGHLLAMRIFNYRDLNIFFIPLIGAVATGSKDTVSQKQKVIILLSGPVPGIIIGLLIFYLGFPHHNLFLIKTATIFVLINMFNLLPVMPLDGGMMLKNMFFETNETISGIFRVISAAVLTYLSIRTRSFYLLIIPYLLIAQFGSNSQLKKAREAIKNKGIDLNKTYDELPDKDYWLIRDEIGSHFKLYSKYIVQGQYVISKYEKRIVAQVKILLEKRPVRDLTIPSKVFITLIWMLAFLIPSLIASYYYFNLR